MATSNIVSLKEKRLATRNARLLAEETAFQARLEQEVERRLATHLEKQTLPLSVIGQIKLAFQKEHRLSLFCGFILGGFVPLGTYFVVHYDLPKILGFSFRGLEYLLVAGGLVFSAKTCIAWTNQAFRDKWKALGWVVLLEGIMVLTPIQYLAIAGLALLILINGIATGCNLALQKD